MTRSPSPETPLAAVVEGELAACRAILAATEAIEAALEPLDLDAVEAGLGERARQFAILETLETAALALRGRVQADQATPALVADLADLGNLTAQVKDADARAQVRAVSALAGLEHNLRGVNHAQKGLQGYRGNAGPEPRFADRKG